MIRGVHAMFYSDDPEGTRAFLRGIRDDGFGFTTELMLPGRVRVQLYQPKYGG